MVAQRYHTALKTARVHLLISNISKNFPSLITLIAESRICHGHHYAHPSPSHDSTAMSGDLSNVDNILMSALNVGHSEISWVGARGWGWLGWLWDCRFKTLELHHFGLGSLKNKGSTVWIMPYILAKRRSYIGSTFFTLSRKYAALPLPSSLMSLSIVSHSAAKLGHCITSRFASSFAARRQTLHVLA